MALSHRERQAPLPAAHPLTYRRGALVQPARVKFPLVNPQLRRDLGIVAAHFLDGALGWQARSEPTRLPKKMLSTN